MCYIELMELPTEYLENKFYELVPRPLKTSTGMQGECPYCREGKSRNRKRRFFYYKNKGFLICFNCGVSKNGVDFLKEIGGMDFRLIQKDLVDMGCSDSLYKKHINLNDYKKKSKEDKNWSLTWIDAKQNKTCWYYIIERKLNVAINRPKRFYYDTIEKRLVIPSFDGNKIETFQTRRLLDDDSPKYLTPTGLPRIWGIHQLNLSIPYIFVFEGPIDAMFVQNGIAVMGAKTTNEQINKIKLSGLEPIFILDNDNNPDVEEIRKKLIRKKLNVWNWPKTIKYKDINEWAVDKNVNEIPYNMFLKKFN